jgi:hypothetical protein
MGIMKTAILVLIAAILFVRSPIGGGSAIFGGGPDPDKMGSERSRFVQFQDMHPGNLSENQTQSDMGANAAQNTAVILDDPLVTNTRTWVQRWELGEPNPGGVPPQGWCDVAGWSGFDTFQINVTWSGDDILFQIFTDFPQTGYLDGRAFGYPQGGLYQLADLVFDLDLDGIWETGIPLIDHGPIPADPSNPNPPGYGWPAHHFSKGGIYSFDAWFIPQDIHYYHPGYSGSYDLGDPKPPPPVWMRLGTHIGKAEIAYNDLGTIHPTYRIDIFLKGINRLGEWDSLGLVWGTANCDNDVIQGTVHFSGRTVYIAQDGFCGGYTPCFSDIQQGINWKGQFFTIKIQEGMYDEDIVLDEVKRITLEGGWNSEFSELSGSSTIRSITINGAGAFEFGGRVVIAD